MYFVQIVFCLFFVCAFNARAMEETKKEVKKSILLFGKTGSGKTSLIQMAHEHAKNSAYDNARDFIVPIVTGNVNIGLHQVGVVDSAQSQTKGLSSFREHFVIANGEFEFIDSQGLFDTDGKSLLDAQKEMTDYLADHPIHAVALVIPSSESRNTKQIEEMFSFLDTVFGDDQVMKNFIVLVTFAPSGDDNNIANLLKGHLKNPEEQLFFFDNSSLIKSDKETVNNLRRQLWNVHRENFLSMISYVSNLPRIKSIIFKKRAELLQNAEEILRNLDRLCSNIAILKQKVIKAKKEELLAQSNGYTKWNCGYKGDNLAINTVNTAIYSEKRQGGIAGALGGTKTYQSGTNTTRTCSYCGGNPASHTSNKLINLNGKEEVSVSLLLEQLEHQKNQACIDRENDISTIKLLRLTLDEISNSLNENGRSRDYISELLKHLSLEPKIVNETFLSLEGCSAK